MKKPLQDGVITLQPLTTLHTDSYITLANIAAINKRINEPMPYRQEHFVEVLNKSQTDHLYVWMIEYQDALCGVVNSGTRVKGLYQGGYWIHPDQWGKGLAAQAVTLVRDFLFAECGAKRVQAVVEPDNSASMRVLEKCGYRQEGLMRKFYLSKTRGLIDVYMYGCVKGD